MTGLIIKIAMSVISTVVVALIGYIARQLHKQGKMYAANARGTMLLLRIQLIEYHSKYCIDGETMPSYAYENFCDMYEAYKALGGNGMTGKMKKEMDARKLGDRRKVNWPTNG